jgi:bifunctional ADP-heptose synthase (sugar kinase/adenylyltransferase)
MMRTPARRFAEFRDAVRKSRVLIVGDVMLDRYWFGDVERISQKRPCRS